MLPWLVWNTVGVLFVQIVCLGIVSQHRHLDDAPPATVPDEQDGGPRSPGLSCYLNRDCQPIEFCVKPDRNTFSLGVCTMLPEFVPSRSEDHSRDLHFVVRNVRLLNEPSASRCKRQGRVEQRAHRGLQPSFDITAYLYNTYVSAD
ncbi:hypothetical protein HPB47_004381 [Ixodes persulcatus]|uniref:Uncharacterized protein n=1 Tax=Ixodes persulcatus TaxID=34615 RepID=A0AC60PFW2_IXOPE|nr:hypothetical protein HPB47_004381 [Ixodes persulcatus]